MGPQAGWSLLCGPGVTGGWLDWAFTVRWPRSGGSWLCVVRGSACPWGVLMVVCQREESKMTLKCLA